MKLDLVSFDAQLPAIRHVRTTVFTLEQGVDPAIDFDGLDAEAVHVLCTDNDQPVGTGRMLDDGHIGRIAVLADYRAQGIGRLLMQTLIDTARARHYDNVSLYAQVNAVPFYEKLGFKANGENFTEAGIEHTPMELKL